MKAAILTAAERRSDEQISRQRAHWRRWWQEDECQQQRQEDAESQQEEIGQLLINGRRVGAHQRHSLADKVKNKEAMKLSVIKNDIPESAQDMVSYYQWLERIFTSNIDGLKEITSDQNAPAYAMVYARAVAADLSSGKTITIDKIFERLMSRPSIEHEEAVKMSSAMMRKKVEHKKRYIISLLRKEGKYKPELSLQVKIVAQLSVKAEMLADEVFSSDHRSVNVETSREGNARESISPKERLYQDYLQQLQRALKALSMNNDAKSAKGEEAVGIESVLSQLKFEPE